MARVTVPLKSWSLLLCAMQVCQIVLLCLGTVVIKKLTAVLLNVTDDVSYFCLVAVLR